MGGQMAGHGEKDNGAWDVALVSYFHMLECCVNSYLYPSKVYISLKGHNPVFCSNYNRRYYRLCYKIPSSSEDVPKDHLYPPEDPWALPPPLQ